MTDAWVELAVDDVEFVKELYPRLREDEAAIERYRAAVDRLPPIVVARRRVLVDGFHRLQAHRREGIARIRAVDLGNLTDAEMRLESIQRNAVHGQQLSQPDKRRLAGILWRDFAAMRNGERGREIAALLSVSERSVDAWTRDARATEKSEQQARAWDLWLDCLDYRAIESQTGVAKSTGEEWVSEKRKSAEFGQPPESRQHFDVWQFQTADGESTYFGKMPPQVVENLLWLYTQPSQIVVDVFAGGGTTIDVAKRMGRRVWASDLNPSTPTLPIHAHDIRMGWPERAPDRVDFVLLDPPYWKQAAGRYSQDQADMANVDLEGFRQAWARVIDACIPHLRVGGHLAFVVSPTADRERVVDHAFEMYATVCMKGLHAMRRIIVTYSSQQALGYDVTWARDAKQLLKRYRDLVVFERRE
jgi:DNA modification methylase